MVGQPGLRPTGWAGDDDLAPIVDQWTLHQLGMAGEQTGHRLDGHVVVGVEAECLEAGILADQVAGRLVEASSQAGELGRVWWLFEVFDDVELDVGRLEQCPNLPRSPSAAVEVERDHLGDRT